ncbi:MAG: hypothetical protein M1840_001510 [Geoglossum simile]|nr:MAG: hypothetical protein M1840_001510 [Geoglossum simile]
MRATVARYHSTRLERSISYTVWIAIAASLFRVSLPVDPHHKTQSEVATIRFLQQQTKIPVPHIIGFDDSSDNELGFEWILMEFMPGRPLRQQWRKMSTETKHDLIKSVAVYHTQLLRARPRFAGIGNIFPLSDQKWEKGSMSRSECLKLGFRLGRIVSMLFFWGDHINQDVYRGPFRTSHDWLHARLTFALNDQDRTIRESDDDDEIEQAKDAKDLIVELHEMLPCIFTPKVDIPEQTALRHSDLSFQNILVDESGKITAVLDWECVSTVPMWDVVQLLDFLMGLNREEEPVRDEYMDESIEEEEEAIEEGLDNEGKNTLYWVHQLEYEQTQLRRLYSAEMEQLWPEWKMEVHNGTRKADFDAAVSRCGTGFGTAVIQDWLEDLQEGEYWCLRDRYMGVP